MSKLRIALAQLNTTVGDIEGNQGRIAEAILRAKAWFTDLVIVPELALTGYPPEDLLLKPQFIDANERALKRLLPLTQGIVAIVGYVQQQRDGSLYNAAAVLAGGRRLATYHKRCLPNYGVFDEKRYFTPGSEVLLLQVGKIPVGVTICEDLWELQPARDLAKAGAQLIVNLSASPYHAGKLALRQKLFSKRAKENGVCVAFCNLIGGQDELVFDGASLVVDASGSIVGQARQFAEDLLVVDLELASKSLPQRPALPALAKQGILKPVEEIYEALSLGLKDYVRKNGFSSVVLGLSGGVDSALTATIAVDALGSSRVKALVMPSRFSSRETQQDARKLAETLGIESWDVSIESLFVSYLKTLRRFFRSMPANTTEQNIQARIRGNLLMALSNKFGWLVLTTGNKSETATGYTTLYGDMAGGLALIKDVPKTLVYQLARYRNRRRNKPVIPQSILQRAPTAELALGQKDQDTLPPYEMLDRILQAYVEENRSLKQIIQGQRVPVEVAQSVVKMVDRSEYKRRQAPPGIKITPRAFGRDRRMPITNQYQEC
ncbi:MAG: NAD+ synthase [Candidatus Omnitrophica bacterium]|nr:NAD+ synthase [Candidatus Omnitrophota bacterium]